MTRHGVFLGVLIFLAAAGLCGLGLAKAIGGSVARITIHNPYSFAVRMEAKCDWNRRRRRFDFRKVFILPARGRYLLKVPKKHDRCEIWPKVLW